MPSGSCEHDAKLTTTAEITNPPRSTKGPPATRPLRELILRAFPRPLRRRAHVAGPRRRAPAIQSGRPLHRVLNEFRECLGVTARASRRRHRAQHDLAGNIFSAFASQIRLIAPCWRPPEVRSAPPVANCRQRQQRARLAPSTARPRLFQPPPASHRPGPHTSRIGVFRFIDRAGVSFVSTAASLGLSYGCMPRRRRRSDRPSTAARQSRRAPARRCAADAPLHVISFSS